MINGDVIMFKKTIMLGAVLFLLCSLGLAAPETKKHTQAGFSFSLNSAYRPLNSDLNGQIVVFSSPYSLLKVFTQDLDNVSANTYIEYGNYQLYRGKAAFTVIDNQSLTINKKQVRIICYYRPQISCLEDDRNYYLEMHVRGEKKVFTFWAKTTQAFYAKTKTDLEEAVKSFAEVGNRQEKVLTPATSVESPHIHYEGLSITLDIPPDKLVWGRFYPGVPFYEESYANMLQSEKKLGHKFEFIMTYCRFPAANPFPEEAIRKVYADGRVLMLTLQPFTSELDWIAVPEFIAGLHDKKIEEWALGLKEIGEPVFVRPLNEMNGDWDPWCAWFFGKDTDLYILAWRHIVNIFKEVGADNVLFVWNPHDRSYPAFTWNNPHQYYPGDDYVDWIGLTGYNNGTSHPADVWREFEDIYRPLYNDYLKRYPHKPFMITEFSCNETGGDKAAWISAGLAALAENYPNIRIANWFDAQDNMWLYQLDSSPQAFEAFRKGLSQEMFIKSAVQISP